ncbi:MAG: hypothetical protein ACHQ15_05475, partial [Candidatus Limnocylindrales bacterium]
MLGRPCALGLPGCTGVADTADHVVPVSRGGAGRRPPPGVPPLHQRQAGPGVTVRARVWGDQGRRAL